MPDLYSKLLRHVCLAVVFVTVSTPVLSEDSAAASEPAPLNQFSRLPAFDDVNLSPKGDRLVFVRNEPTQDLSLLMTFDLKTQQRYSLLKSDNRKVKFNWVAWANNEDLLVSARYESRQGTVKYYQTRLLTLKFNGEGGPPKPVVHWKSIERYGNRTHTPQFQDKVIDMLVDDPDHILMAIDISNPNEPSVFKVSLSSNRISRIVKGKKKIRGWITDQQGKIRIAEAFDYKTNDNTIYLYDEEREEFTTLFEYNDNTDLPIIPMGFGLSPDILYYKKYKGEFKALYTRNLKTGEDKEVFSDPEYDVDGRLIYANSTRDVIGVYHANADNGRHYFTNPYETLQKSVDGILEERRNYFVDFSQDDMTYILYSESDTSPGIYLLGSRVDGSLGLLFEEYPEINPDSLSPHKLIKYTARDNVEIEGYLTTPKFGEAPYPTIIFPHGGPGVREYAGFDYWTAYFTSRGYAVLRPNFRGSSGYGYSFANAQMEGWGLAMQNDVADATEWMVAQGLADKKRMCIVGASYGGYAALAAAVKSPKLFQCVVSFAGVSDLDRVVMRSRAFLNKRQVADQIGNDGDDRDRRSPINYVEYIEAPIFLAHGNEDRIVHVEQSRYMAEELDDEDKDFEYLELEDGDHYLSIQSNRHTFFERLDAFLNKYL